MLVLTRRIKESILIGSQIRITVISIKGQQVRLGIKAPTEVPVMRHELHMKRQADVVGSAGRADETEYSSPSEFEHPQTESMP